MNHPFVKRSATKAAIAQAFLSAARRDARSDVAHIAPEVAAAYTLRSKLIVRREQNTSFLYFFIFLFSGNRQIPGLATGAVGHSLFYSRR